MLHNSAGSPRPAGATVAESSGHASEFTRFAALPVTLPPASASLGTLRSSAPRALVQLSRVGRSDRNANRGTSLVSVRLILAWLHLVALAIGVGGIWSRARALHDSLREPENPGALRRALVGDAWWGIAAVLWIVTGVWRLLGATEKTTGYYLGNHAFLGKMGLFALVAALEIWPMKTLLRWRFHKAEPNPRDVGRIEIISYVQCALVLMMVFFAVSMARGYGVAKTAETSVQSRLAHRARRRR